MKNPFVKSKKGFGLVEALVAMALIGVTVYLASNVMIALTTFRGSAQKALDILVVRSNLMAQIQNDELWTQNVTAAASTFSCLNSMTNDACRSAAAPSTTIKYLDKNNGVLIDSSDPNAGLDQKGQPCTPYGSSTCFIRPSVTWKAICPVNGFSCSSPLIQVDIEMQSTLTQNTLVAYLLPPLKAKLIRGPGNCTATNTALLNAATLGNWQANAVNVTSTGGEPATNVTNTSNAAYAPTVNFATIQANINPCGIGNFRFRPQMLNLANASNKTQVCLINANTNACEYVWIATGGPLGYTWDLKHTDSTGTLVTDLTAQVATATKTFRFEVNSQRVNFYYDENLVWVFETGAYLPLKLRASPPPADVSGIGSVTGRLQFYTSM